MKLQTKRCLSVFSKVVFTIVFSMIYFGSKDIQTYAAEAVICHEHATKCYEEKWVQCEDRHDISHYYQDVYCEGCQRVSSAIFFVETYVCDYTGSYREFKRTGHCCNCPTVVLLQEKQESAMHGRMGKVCVCGMSSDTVITKAEFTKSTEEWTNGEVVLNVSVTEPVAGVSNAPYTYVFSGGVTSGTSCTVNENGNYSVTITAVNGQQMTASLQVNNIDKISPKIEKCYVDKEYPEYTSANIVVEATDELSGLADCAYSFDGGKTFGKSGSFKVLANGTYSIVVKDKAGNCTGQTITVSCFAKKADSSNQTQTMPSVQSPNSETLPNVQETKVQKTDFTGKKGPDRVEETETKTEDEYALLKEKLEHSKARVPLDKIPGVYSSLMRTTAEKKAVPMILNVINEKAESAYSKKTDSMENIVKNITISEENEVDNGTFAQVTKATVATGVLLCIGMMAFLIIFLVKKQ